MSTLLQGGYGVPVLVCSLDLPPAVPDERPGAPRVSFAVELGTETRYHTTVAASAMRLPPSFEAVEQNAGVKDMTLPSYLTEELRGTIRDCGTDGPVWLRLAAPYGHLSAVPWEHLLQAELGFPILRLPEITLPGIDTSKQLDVVVCACRAERRLQYSLGALLDRVVAQVRNTVEGATRLHVFTDDSRQRQRLANAGSDVLVYAPPDRLPPPDQSAAPVIENGWLRWIVKELGESSVDIVHFVCPGHLAAGQGSLKLDVTFAGGSDGGWPLVHAGELAAFLKHVAASSVGFTIPSSKGWPAGIRVLAHRVMRELIGPVFVDAPHHERSLTSRATVYPLLFGPPPVKLPTSPAIGVYVHPRRVFEAVPGIRRSRQAEDFDATASQLADELTLAGTPLGAEITGQAQPPRRLVANQRELEQLASELLAERMRADDDESAEGGAPARERGTKAALAFLRDVIATDSCAGRDEWEPLR